MKMSTFGFVSVCMSGQVSEVLCSLFMSGKEFIRHTIETQERKLVQPSRYLFDQRAMKKTSLDKLPLRGLGLSDFLSSSVPATNQIILQKAEVNRGKQ